MKSSGILVLVLAFIFVFFPLVSRAQVVTKGFNMIVTPITPHSNEKVRVDLESYSIDLPRSAIKWYLNGALVDSGTGNTVFETTTGASGQSLTIKASVTIPGGTVFEKDITLTPTDVDILWEAPSSYVPPFYKGKALPSSEGTLKFVAIPSVKTSSGGYLKPSSFVYNWKHAFTTDASASGLSKDSYSIKNSYLNSSESVQVTSTDPGSGFSGSADITVAMQTPEVLFYEETPLGGLNLSRVLENGFRVEKNEMTIFAAPYNIGPKDLSSNVFVFDWKAGTTAVPTPFPANIITIQKPTQGGSSNISVSISNKFKLFGDVLGKLTLTY